MNKFKRIVKITTVCAMIIGIIVFIAILLPILLILAVPFFGYGYYLLLNEQDKVKDIDYDIK